MEKKKNFARDQFSISFLLMRFVVVAYFIQLIFCKN